MKFSALLIDDELAAHYILTDLLKKYTDTIEVIGEAFRGQEAVALANRFKPDLLFLDIHLTDMNAFEMLERLDFQPYVIFTTAFEQYAVRAFQENSVDYLLKPIDEKRFGQCMAKLQRLGTLTPGIDYVRLKGLFDSLQQKEKATAIPIHINSKIVLVRCSDITYCKASDGYVSLMTDDGKEHTCDLTLLQLEERLPDAFIRVQKSYIVNKEKVDEIHKYFNNRLILVMNDKYHTRITTGTSYINLIREKLLL